MKYKDLRHELKTGDLISFSGKGRTSNIIKHFTRSDISHVGLVMGTEFNNALGYRVLLIESTTLNNIPDIKTGELVKGVQMHQLSKRLDGYKGQAYWHKLNVDLKPCEEDSMLEWLSSQHNKRTPYDTLQALGAGIDVLDFVSPNEPDFSSLFCSELVSRALQIAGIVDAGVNPSEATPADVIKYSCFDERIELLQ